MNKLLLLMAGLFFVNFATGATSVTCSPEIEGKRSCRSGEMMKCVKRFDPNSKAFMYEWDGVNAEGQTFSTNTAMYKKVAGFTPMSCPDSNSARK